MAKQNAYPRFTSKPMILSWACLTKEEEYQGKSTGKYSIRGTFAKIEDTNALLTQLEGVYNEYCKTNNDLKNLKRKRNSLPNFGESENANTGELSFKFTTRSTWPSKTGEADQPKIVPCVDAKGKPYRGPIGNGSIGRICFSVAPKATNSEKYGTALWLEAVQILELKEYTAGVPSADEFGFGIEEGFSAPVGEPEECESNPFDEPANELKVGKEEDF